MTLRRHHLSLMSFSIICTWAKPPSLFYHFEHAQKYSAAATTNHTKLNQKPDQTMANQTRPYHAEPNQTMPNQTGPNAKLALHLPTTLQWPAAGWDVCPVWRPGGSCRRGRLPRSGPSSDSPREFYRGLLCTYVLYINHLGPPWQFLDLANMADLSRYRYDSGPEAVFTIELAN